MYAERDLRRAQKEAEASLSSLHSAMHDAAIKLGKYCGIRDELLDEPVSGSDYFLRAERAMSTMMAGYSDLRSALAGQEPS